ncbi:hypothetical protein KW801_03780 [Candidatus Saccharibacteria bacterium]|nr:hypothetical protein [Candidatus Saccharibacteria bacterium]
MIIVAALATAAVLLAVLVYQPEPAVQPAINNRNNQLKVSNNGVETNSNSSLQPATPPERSASSSDLSPQQAQPNYCASDEVPYQDACVPR